MRLRTLLIPTVLIVGMCTTLLVAQTGGTPAPAQDHEPLVYEVPGPQEQSTLYATGETVTVDTSNVWKPICGSNHAELTRQDLVNFAEAYDARFGGPDGQKLFRPLNERDADKTIGFNITFNIDGSVPSSAQTALAEAESYLESLYGDDVSISLSVSFANLGGGGLLGFASSAYVSNVTYTNSYNGLVGGMDSDDVIQDWLPVGSTIPVRYDGGSATITDESYIEWTKANYRAAVGTTSGTAASITFNSIVDWDYNPSNGVPSYRISFIDVVVHEVGHTLGFVTGIGLTGNEMTSLDIYRFQRTDAFNDYNPDTYAEFQTTPRLVDYDTPDDQHISDIIAGEYRMADGDPYQASHFREQSFNWIGLMDPALTGGETHYPDYFSSADIAMFDAIGWDYPACDRPSFTQQPQDQEACVGDNIVFTVAVDMANVSYQWRKNNIDLTDDGHYVGTDTDTLSIVGVETSDVGNYTCVVTNLDEDCPAQSDPANLSVGEAPVILQQPVDNQVDDGYVGDLFSVTADGQSLSYQWRKDGVDLENGVNGYLGANSDVLGVWGANDSHEGVYDVVITDADGCGTVYSNAVTLTVGEDEFLLGDMDCSGAVDFDDISPFVLALSGEAAYYGQYPDCNWMNADCNEDGDVDFDDINAFVLLIGG